MKIHPKRIVHFLQNRFQIFFESTILYDVIEIRRIFYKEVGYRCHLFFPRSFNEKINWYKLHDTNPFYADLIDKIKVKEIVGKIIGEEYVIPTLFGGFKSVAEVPWGELSFPCVVKCNHDSGSTIVLTDRGG